MIARPGRLLGAPPSLQRPRQRSCQKPSWSQVTISTCSRVINCVDGMVSSGDTNAGSSLWHYGENCGNVASATKSPTTTNISRHPEREGREMLKHLEEPAGSAGRQQAWGLLRGKWAGVWWRWWVTPQRKSIPQMMKRKRTSSWPQALRSRLWGKAEISTTIQKNLKKAGSRET